MGRVSSRSKYLLIAAVLGLYGYIALRGPQGIRPLLEKREEIRTLQEQNAQMAHEVEMRRQRIRRLEESTSEQEMEIRKQLKMVKPGETTFILPEAH